jgi:hypothetical protein
MRPSLIVIKLLLIVMIPGAGCASRPTGLDLITKGNPPVFKLSGDSYFLTFTVSGPFPSLSELQNDTGKYVSVWEINTKTTADSRTPIEKLPQISYGTLPYGFAQFRPYDKQPAPPLEPRKFYKAEVFATHGKSDGRGGRKWERSASCFLANASGVEEVSCK